MLENISYLSFWIGMFHLKSPLAVSILNKVYKAILFMAEQMSSVYPFP